MHYEAVFHNSYQTQRIDILRKLFWLKDTCIPTPSWLWKIDMYYFWGERDDIDFDKRKKNKGCLPKQ